MFTTGLKPDLTRYPIDVLAVGCVIVDNQANSIGAEGPVYAVRKRKDEIMNHAPHRLNDVAMAQNL
jgi:hypothetical protein